MHRISLHHAMSLRKCRYSHERHKRGKHKRNDWSNVIFPWHCRRKTTEDATSSNENKTAGRAFLRSVAFPLTTRTRNKITPTFFPLVLSVFHFFSPFFIFFSLPCDFLWRSFLLFKSFRYIFKPFRSFYKSVYNLHFKFSPHAGDENYSDTYGFLLLMRVSCYHLLALDHLPSCQKVNRKARWKPH